MIVIEIEIVLQIIDDETSPRVGRGSGLRRASGERREKRKRYGTK